jgi:hypothetical protein
MFMTPGLAWILIAIKFIAGSVIGLIVAVLVYRKRLFRAAILSGFALIFASGLAGWADTRAIFEDGKRASFAPDGEDLRIRNFLVENELPIELVASCGAALLAGVGNRRPRTNDQ